ncbi:MAG: hypothetical protein JNL14_03325 [Devosia sp.]|uniref:hypothetical protein n=1 Tax=Devosia sp. TaxID=1871048 RepID=UPI001A59BA9B|nr:hypothetical protein [Devosia sp.]MBL8596751.1 hypothetical protein [Devosia sp.]
MTTQELLIGEINVVADFVELLARRAHGEISALYPDARDAAETIMYLRNDAPGFLQPELAMLEARCTSILRSIAN